MLPNKMKISDNAFNSLRRFQNNTGITVNISARLAFFKSIESLHQYQGEDIVLNQRELDKHSWLGDQTIIVEMLLKERYPSLNNKDIYKAWGSHVEDGAKIIGSTANMIALAVTALAVNSFSCNSSDLS